MLDYIELNRFLNHGFLGDINMHVCLVTLQEKNKVKRHFLNLFDWQTLNPSTNVNLLRNRVWKTPLSRKQEQKGMLETIYFVVSRMRDLKARGIQGISS